MSDEFKMTPLEQVKQQLLSQMKAQEGVAVFETPRDKHIIQAVMHESDGRRVELIDKHEYYKALDEKQIAEERLEAAHAEILRLNTIITYLESRYGRTEEGSVQVGDRQGVPSQDRGTSPAPETD